ncbi:hypothetical protein QAD02_005706 [Eretmocerus hayati]|uniref:Uncharacterized protein n=1 Tax=Eretmocerus hayati TaxID=131215 RepID=A0ACC2NTM9_9HYME|nr:hypothetical protein QAD02_005706 [Eretmocerus hayati]
MCEPALLVLQFLLLSTLYTQETESWRMGEYSEEMNTLWDQWGPVSDEKPKENQGLVKFRSKKYCKATSTNINKYPFFALVTRDCYSDTRMTDRIDSRYDYCIIVTSTDIFCNYGEPRGLFCDATAKLVDGTEIPVKKSNIYNDTITHHILLCPIEPESRAKPIRSVESSRSWHPSPGSQAVRWGLLETKDPLIIRNELIHKEVVTLVDPGDCSQFSDIGQSECLSWPWINAKSSCPYQTGTSILLVDGKLAGIERVSDPTDGYGETLITFVRVTMN